MKIEHGKTLSDPDFLYTSIENVDAYTEDLNKILVDPSEVHPLTYKLRTAYFKTLEQGAKMGTISENERVQCIDLYLHIKNIVKKGSIPATPLKQFKIILNDLDAIDFLEQLEMNGVVFETSKYELQEEMERFGKTEDTLADQPFGIIECEGGTTINRRIIEAFVSDVGELEDAFRDLPRRNLRNRVLLSNSIKKQIKELLLIPGVTYKKITERTGLHRSTVWEWTKDETCYGTVPNLKQLFDEMIAGWTVDIDSVNGIAYCTKDYSKKGMPDAELTDKLSAMITNSPTLKSMQQNGALEGLSMDEIRDIYIKDTTKDTIANINKERDKQLLEKFQQEGAFELGLLPIFNLSNMNSWKSYKQKTPEFRTCEEINDPKAYAIRIDSNDLTPVLFRDCTVIVSPGSELKTNEPARVLVQYANTETKEMFTYIGTYNSDDHVYYAHGKPASERIETIQLLGTEEPITVGFSDGFLIKEGDVNEVIKNQEAHYKLDKNIRLVFCHKIIEVKN